MFCIFRNIFIYSLGFAQHFKLCFARLGQIAAPGRAAVGSEEGLPDIKCVDASLLVRVEVYYCMERRWIKR